VALRSRQELKCDSASQDSGWGGGGGGGGGGHVELRSSSMPLIG
jgi:hypothetical protein